MIVLALLALFYLVVAIGCAHALLRWQDDDEWRTLRAVAVFSLAWPVALTLAVVIIAGGDWANPLRIAFCRLMGVRAR